MAVLDAATAAQRWQQSAGTAQQRFTDGVQQTAKDPTALAAAQAQKALANFQQAISSGLWQRRLQDVGAAGWKSATVAKAANYGTGINASVQKYQQAYAAMQPTMQSLQAQIDGMPHTTLADSIARATAWMTGMHNYRLQRA